MSFIRSAARVRTPSGSPSPHTSGGRTPWWRASIGSQTPGRRGGCRSTSTRGRGARAARAGRRRSRARPARGRPRSGRPSRRARGRRSPTTPPCPARSSSVRSAHWPVKSVIGLAIIPPASGARAGHSNVRDLTAAGRCGGIGWQRSRWPPPSSHAARPSAPRRSASSTDAYDGVSVRPGKGLPHAQAVADVLRRAGSDERAQLLALLHDVVEDTPRTIDDVRERLRRADGRDGRRPHRGPVDQALRAAQARPARTHHRGRLPGGRRRPGRQDRLACATRCSPAPRSATASCATTTVMLQLALTAGLATGPVQAARAS